MRRRQDNSKMPRTVTACVCLLLLSGCHNPPPEEDIRRELPGAWTLVSVAQFEYNETPISTEYEVHCRIIGTDSTYYDCQLWSTASGIVVMPEEKGIYSIETQDDGKVVYRENGYLRPLQWMDDTTIVIQRYGNFYKWVRNRSMSKSRQKEIRKLVDEHERNGQANLMNYVLSTSERKLKATNKILAGVLAVAGLAVMWILASMFRLQRHKKQVEEQLQQLQEEQELRPQAIRDAIQKAENEFLSSEFLISLHQRIAAGEKIESSEWEELGRKMRPIYTDFFHRLPGLCKMSVTEYRVCVLIRLHFSPKEIADVLCKDSTTISSIRSRLYKKVFGKKGGSKEWDDFIRTL